jgi:hypothetical protein
MGICSQVNLSQDHLITNFNFMFPAVLRVFVRFTLYPKKIAVFSMGKFQVYILVTGRNRCWSVF